LPQVAPLLPADRPEEAPPREVAAKPEAKEGADDEAAEKSPAPANKSAADGNKAQPHKPATKKRR
jgi:hypothetical protein